MTPAQSSSLSANKITIGDELPPFDMLVTTTKIVAGAIASCDFMPMHHDREYAMSQGAPDVFFNIHTSNGYVSRFVTDWAGPEAMLKSIKVRLGVQAVPGQILRFSGEVMQKSQEGDECIVEVAVRAANVNGDHATGTVKLTLPL